MKKGQLENLGSSQNWYSFLMYIRKNHGLRQSNYFLRIWILMKIKKTAKKKEPEPVQEGKTFDVKNRNSKEEDLIVQVYAGKTLTKT